MSTGQAPRRAGRRPGAGPGIARVLHRLHGLIVPPLRRFNAGLRAVCAGSHHLQYKVEGFLRPSAEWFDHEIDVHWQWVARQRSMFLERGVLNTLAIRPGAEILEICCGDGFNAHRFYAGRGARVLAVDHNRAALRHARRFHARANLEYRRCDILQDIPEGPFDNVVWDAAIHHFTAPQVAVILSSVHRSLAPDGVLSGYTVIEPDDSYSYTHLRFTDPQPLADLLAGEFAHVTVLETPDALRRNLHFFASDAREALPFEPGVHRGPSPATGSAPTRVPARE
ncbi:MAG TPA: class I SAM-dependent methyltransferase [Solirubrobacteraceae bacterium]|nr:class I SAM-dependent methyltransferase [Solirubrobacteraceae bacterium]